MQSEDKRLLDKLYLSRMSISTCSEYYNMLLKNFDVTLIDDEQDIEIDFKNMFVSKKYLKETSIVRLSNKMVESLESYFTELGLYSKKLSGAETNDDFNGENEVKVDGEDGVKKKAEKYWKDKVEKATKALCNRGKGSEVPSKAKLYYDNEKSEEINWKEELFDFILHDISDYTLTPPDKRYLDSKFLLPAYNEVDDDMENILFMFDTSASMKKEIISDVANEVKNIVYQFRGNMRGFVGSFDTRVYDVKEFSDPSDLKDGDLQGGGGTSFISIFDYIRKEMRQIELKAVIILTDGHGDFPYVWETMNIPVLWVMTDNVTPKFGKIIRYKGGN